MARWGGHFIYLAKSSPLKVWALKKKFYISQEMKRVKLESDWSEV